ncbi:hypothetical protein [Teredinibacter sp. KSP-S5-2]|uniref:tetratricopeptide repeat protein n=1 Tax=Teredinibacter sp. KSP-S5-2 TaxID=3034506 RepID=UPI002935064D|nr:hypothetical protein [Teredinibacter sp. KSP-S5-2]WNO08899.1 hypothetical protein P5V12_18285 [Teredinibacter sp. KSP-S5-2]
MIRISLYLIATTLIISACSENKPITPSESRDLSISPYLTFCDSLANSLSNNETSIISKNLNNRIIIRNSLLGIDIPQEYKSEYSSAFKSKIPEIALELENSIKGMGYWYTLTAQNEKNCYMHSSLTERGLYIIGFRLSNTNNTVEIIDWEDYSSSIKASDSIRSVIKDVTHYEKTYGEVSKFNSFSTAINQNNPATAWRIIKSMPEEIRNNRTYTYRILTLINENHPIYQEVMKTYEKLVSKEDRGLIFYDYYLSKNDLNGALNVVSNIERKTSNDALFELMRASAYLNTGNKKQFLSKMAETIDEGETYEDAYLMLMDFFINEKLYKEATMSMDILEKAHGYEFTRDIFLGQAEYEDFAKSETFNSWYKSKR